MKKSNEVETFYIGIYSLFGRNVQFGSFLLNTHGLDCAGKCQNLRFSPLGVRRDKLRDCKANNRLCVPRDKKPEGLPETRSIEYPVT